MRKIIALSLLVAVSACNTKSNHRQGAEDLEQQHPVLANINAGRKDFKVDIPIGWAGEQRTVDGIAYYIAMPPSTDPDPAANINIITERMTYAKEEYLKKVKEQLLKTLPGTAMIDEGNMNGKSLQGTWFKYSVTPEGRKSIVMCYTYTDNGVAYLITAHSTEQTADHYRPVFDTIAASFHFENK